MVFRNTLIGGFSASFVALSGGAFAQDNPPPAGNVIYSLTGQSISSTYQEGSADFVASQTGTDISFAFREDPAFLELTDVSVVDLTTGSTTNLIVNGDFSQGTYTGSNGAQQPDGWNYLNIYNASASGRVENGCGPSGGYCYFDGSVGSYDAIDQLISTTIGDMYEVSFYYADDFPNGIYEPTGEGTGRDMFVYAGTAPMAAPEPASFVVLVAGLAGLSVLRRRRAV